MPGFEEKETNFLTGIRDEFFTYETPQVIASSVTGALLAVTQLQLPQVFSGLNLATPNLTVAIASMLLAPIVLPPLARMAQKAFILILLDAEQKVLNEANNTLRKFQRLEINYNRYQEELDVVRDVDARILNHRELMKSKGYRSRRWNT